MARLPIRWRRAKSKERAGASLQPGPPAIAGRARWTARAPAVSLLPLQHGAFVLRSRVLDAPGGTGRIEMRTVVLLVPALALTTLGACHEAPETGASLDAIQGGQPSGQ